MNVAIIISSLNGGGAEKAAGQMSILLSKEHNVYLIVFDAGEITYPYGGTLIDLKIDMKNLTVQDRKKRVMNLVYRIKRIREIKRENQIDRTISLMDGANIVNVLSRVRDRVIVSVHTNMRGLRKPRTMAEKIRAWVYRQALTKADRVVVVSEGVRQSIIEDNAIQPDKVVTIYNPCDERILSCAAEGLEEDINDNEVIITTMGRLALEKGQWHLLRAFPRVLEKHPDAKLMILGEGELDGTLREIAKKLRIEDRVLFLGYVKDPYSVIKKSTVFAFPSILEGLAYALLEAMGCGVPCVATDCDYGSRELLAPGTKYGAELKQFELAQCGILTPPVGAGEMDAETPLTEAEKQLADAIIHLLQDKALRERYRSASKKRVLDFSPERITADWNRVLQEG